MHNSTTYLVKDEEDKEYVEEGAKALDDGVAIKSEGGEVGSSVVTYGDGCERQ